MLRLALLCSLLVAAAFSSQIVHDEASPETLSTLVETLMSDRSETNVRRNLAQSWTAFNNYFSGISGRPSPQNLPTYYGRDPGPCNLGGTVAERRNGNRCFGRACKMPESVKEIPLSVPLLGEKKIREWIVTDDCGSYPGNIWLYDADAGNIRIGGIYLDTTVPDNNDIIPPPSGFTKAPTAFASEVESFNQFRMTFTLSELQLDFDATADITQLRIQNLPIIGHFDFEKNGVVITLRRSDQTINSNRHALSFRTTMIFRANRQCLTDTASGRTAEYNSTCFYRSDKTPRSQYYRANAQRTESFKEGIVYDIMFPRTPTASPNPSPTAPLDESSCLFDFNNQYATMSPGAAHETALGLRLDVGEVCPIKTWFINWGDPCKPILNFILNLLIGFIIKDILCQLIRGMFWIVDTNNVPTSRGLVNKGVENIYKFFRKYVEDPLTQITDESKLEDKTVPDKFRADGYTWPNAACTGGWCPYPGAVDFNNSELFRAVSLGLNNILGNVSTTDEYRAAGKLTIVEVIDILTGNKEGTVQLGICKPGTTPTCTLDYCAGTCDGDIKAELKLNDYPRFDWDEQPIFDGEIRLNGILLTHMNSITRLKLLDNGFVSAVNPTPVFTHTVTNQFTMKKIGIELFVTITLVDGSWVHRPRQQIITNASNKRKIEMATNIYIEMSDITLDLDLLMLLRTDRMDNKRVGSIFGKFPPGYAVNRLHCAGFALDLLLIQKLQATGTLTDLRFKDFLGDLGTVITAGTKVFDYGFKQATHTFLPFLADNWVRPFFNEILMNNTYDGPCEPDVQGNCVRSKSKDLCMTNYTYYFAANDTNRYINFYDSKVWNLVKGVVNDVVGGVPVRTGSASINTIIDQYLEWYVPRAKAKNMTLVKLPNIPLEAGNVDVNSSSFRIQGEVDGSGAVDPNKLIEFSLFGFRNLETVHELKINPNNPTETRNFRLDFKIGGGKIFDRFNNVFITNGLLGVKFHMKVKVTEQTEGLTINYADDEADVYLQFGNFTVGSDIYALVDQNTMLDLEYGQLSALGCLLSVVDDFELRTLTIGFQSFRLNIARVNPANPSIKWRSRDQCSPGWSVNPGMPFVSSVYGSPCGGQSGRKVRFSDAVDRLAHESQFWGDKVDNMLKYFFNGVAKQIMTAVNSFNLTKATPSSNCSENAVLDGTLFDGFIKAFNNASEASEDALSFYQKIAIDQKNPRFPGVKPNAPSVTMFGSRSSGILAIPYPNKTFIGFPAAQCIPAKQHVTEPTACWEDNVVIDANDKDVLDVQESYLVKEITKYLSKSGQRTVVDAMEALASTAGNFLGDSLIAYAHGTALPGTRGLCNNIIESQPSFCIDVDANMTGKLPIFNDSTFIPGLMIEVKRLRILNIHTFDANPEEFELLKPYVPDQYNPGPRDTDAKFTLAHRIKFSGSSPLEFFVDIDISVAEEFLDLNTPTPKKPIVDTMSLGFKFTQLDLQVMTMTAINATRVQEVPLFYFLDPFNSEKCFFSMFYQNGLQIPQFQVYASDIIGPVVNFAAKSPAGPTANVFSQGIADLIGASIEIFVQLAKKDFPDMTQGEFRKYMNRVLNDYVIGARDAMGPGSCPLKSCGPPDSDCHYQKFTASDFAPIFGMLNSVIGGDPVTTSVVDINTLIARGLDFALINPEGLNLTSRIINPGAGDYFLDTALSFTSGPSYFKIKNLGVTGVDSIYNLSFALDANKPYNLGFDLKLGGGDMMNGTNEPPTLFTSDPFTIHADVEVVVKIQRAGGGPPETIADNEFRVNLIFKGVNMVSIQEILLNKTDLVSLSINQVSNTQCVLAFVDKVTLQSLYMQIADFDVIIPPNDCTTNCVGVGEYGRNPPNCKTVGGGKCNVGKAIDTLRNETLVTNPKVPPQQSVPLSMINTVLMNIGDSLVDSFNSAIDPWNATLEKCDIPRISFSIISGVSNSTHDEQLIERLINNVTGIVTSPKPTVVDHKMITVQSTLLAENDTVRTAFINAVILSAKEARGPKPNPSVELRVASFCERFTLPGYLNLICGGLTDLRGNISAKLEEWTTAQPNLIEENVSPTIIEDRVRVDPKADQFYDIRSSILVEMVSNFTEEHKNNFNQVLKEVANVTTIFRTEEDGSVTLVFNMTDGLIFLDQNLLSGQTCEGNDRDIEFRFQDFLGTSNSLIPSLRILPGMFEWYNFGEFTELVFLKPYKADIEARFTTRHEFGWRNASKPLTINAGVDIFYDQGFRMGTAPVGVIEKEQVNITVTMKELLIQVLTLLAVDTRALGEVRLGDFLIVDEFQAFTKNCKAPTCLMKAIFDGGLFLPQLTINVTDIIGPRITTSRRLFSPGMEQLIDAVVEIFVQLIRDNLAAVTQGPVREFINDKLVGMLAAAKEPGACPERLNYTRTYPKGEYYCSHVDGNGSALLTQNEQQCQSKGNGKLCEWAPPDGLTENTVACFYTKSSRDLNFATARGLQQMKRLVNESLMNPNSSMYINTYLSVFSRPVPTDLWKPVDNLPVSYNGHEYGKATLGIGALRIVGLDTVDRLQIFDPEPFGPGGDAQFKNPAEYEPPTTTGRRLKAGEPVNFDEDEGPQALTLFTPSARRALADDRFGYADNKFMSRTAIGLTGPLSVYFEVLFSFDELFVPRVDGPQDYVENHISIEFILTDFDFAMDLFMLVNIPRLMDLQVRSIGTIYELPCILTIFEDNGLIPARANITYGSVEFDIKCKGRCDSPFFSPLKGTGFSSSTSERLKESFTETFKELTDFLIKLLASSDAQDLLDSQISISNTQCEAIKADNLSLADPKPLPNANAASAMGIAGLASLFASFVGFAMLVPIHFRRRDELMKRALLDAHARGTAGKSKDEFELAERRLKSAFEHPMMPRLVKYGVPAWILLNVIMFATAMFGGAGAIVELTLSIAGDTTYPITILPFTLESSINDMWNSGVYPLALLIAILSGAWPYAKQLLMLFAWFAPATVLHPNARGRLMEVLDALGKWSLIDMYVLLMLMVAFRFYLSSSLVESFSLLPPDVIVVDVVVAGGWGIYGFMLGAMGSLLVNHLMIWWHRKVTRMDEDLQDAILGTLVKDLRTPRIPLSRHRFNILDAEGRPYRYSVAVRVMVVFFLALSFLLLIIGSVLPTITFSFRGLAGLAIAFIDQNMSTVTHSAVSIGTSIIEGARNTAESVLGILFLQILYMLFTLVIPLILLVLLAGIWLVPLTLKEQLLLHFVAEVLFAWQAVAVLIVALIAAVFQISQLAQFIVHAVTGSMCQIVEAKLEEFFPDPSDAKCFNVIATLLPTCAPLFVAVFLIEMICIVAFRLIHTALEDRELAMRRKPPHSPGEMTGLTGFIVRRSLEAFGASQIQNGGSVANLYAQEQGAFDYRTSQMTTANPILAREMPQSVSGMQAPNPMFHGSLGSMSKGPHASIDV